MDIMLRGKIGVLEIVSDGESKDLEARFAAVASAIADATGTFVSSKQPAGTHPCLLASTSTMPAPVGSRWTTHHPRALDKITKASPLDKRTLDEMRKRIKEIYSYTTTSNSSSCSAM